jgi:hypothetical protein
LTGSHSSVLPNGFYVFRENLEILESEADLQLVSRFIVRGGPKNNRNLNVGRELELVARCAASCRESTQYSSSMPRGVSLS